MKSIARGMLGRAYHEAGHAVIARILDIEVYEASILSSDDGKTLGHMLSHVGTDEDEERIMMLHAGGIAQQRAGFEVGVGDFDDLFAIEEQLTRLVLLRDGDFVALYRYVPDDGYGNLSMDQEHAAAKLNECLKRHTRKLVEQHWTAIEFVAKALMRRYTINQSRIDALICDANRSSRSDDQKSKIEKGNSMAKRKTKPDDTIYLGEFETEREAMLVYDRAAVLLYGEDAETYLPAEESAHVKLPPEIMRQINAVKAGRSKPN